MRNALLAFAALSGVLFLSAGSASARDYPYCLRDAGEAGPGTCYYDTYAQCQASASGLNAYCDVNPRIAYAQQPQPYGAPRHRRNANSY